jgi:hypothetical protein
MTSRPTEMLSIGEACAVLDLPGEVVTRLCEGPFAPVNGRVSLRQVLGIATLTELCMLDTAAAVQIAATASADAKPDGKRLLAVAWRDGIPGAAWVEGITDALRRPALVLPVEKLFSELAARMVAYRNAAARPN